MIRTCPLAGVTLTAASLLAGEPDWQKGFLGKADFRNSLKGVSSETEWELDFSRHGRAFDAERKEHDANVPVFEREGLRMSSGSDSESGTGFINLMPADKLYEDGVTVAAEGFTTGALTVEGSGPLALGFDAHGEGGLAVTALLDGVPQKSQTFKLERQPKRFCHTGVRFVASPTPRRSEAPSHTVEYTFSAASGATLRRFVLGSPASFVTAYSKPGRYQVRDLLTLPAALTQQMPEDDFTVLITFTLTATGGLYQPLFEQTRRQRWWPNLSLSFSSQNRNQLVLYHAGNKPKEKNRVAETGLVPETGRPYTVVLTRSNGTATLWVDGRKSATLSDIPVENVSTLSLGCGGPECALDGHLRTFAAWSRALDDAEVAAIDFQKLREPAPVQVAVQSYLRYLARGFQPREYRFLVRNVSPRTQAGLTLEWKVGNQVFAQDIGALEANGERRIALPALLTLKPGDYTQTLSVRRGTLLLNTQSLPATVTPAPVPPDQLQTSPWCQFLPQEPGYTMGTVSRCADAMQAGLNWGPYQFRWTGAPRNDHPEDRALTPKQRHGYSDFYYSAYMREQMRESVAAIARRLAFYPALTHIDINNEFTPNFQVNFRDEALRYAKDRFGLDITPWKAEDRRELVRPIGRLSPVLANYPIPKNRILPENDPLYLWHLDRKGPHGDSESLLNHHIASAMKHERPDVLSVVAPLTRRLSIRGYDDRIDIAQTWCYTPGLRVVWLQEALSAHIRHSRHMRSSSFPAFLPMNVGPYEAMPSGDIFAASCWASLIRPTAMLVFFQPLEMVRGHGKGKEEIDALLGTKTPSTEEAKKLLKEKGLSLTGDHPTLAPRVRKLIAEELPPLRALLPAWENDPRQIAVYSSFADSLFSDERWPSDYTRPLADLTRSGVAYDLLFDEDFQKDPALLDRYNMVFLPSLQYLYEPAWKALTRFAATPGKVIVVPENAHPFFSGAVVVRDGNAPLSAEEQARIVQEVEAQWGTDTSRPMYVEALDAKLAEAAARHAGAEPFATILDAVALEARSLLPHTALNVTRLDRTAFISVVNDLRTWGPVYGHFKVLPEKGVRQTGEVLFNRTLGAHAYNLRRAEKLAVSPADKGRSKVSLTLEGGDAAILLLTDRALGAFRASVARDGDSVCVTGQAFDTDGNALDVSMPCVVTVGGSPDFSGAGLFRNGKLVYRFPFEGALPEVTVREPATGQTVTLK